MAHFYTVLHLLLLILLYVSTKSVDKIRSQNPILDGRYKAYWHTQAQWNLHKKVNRPLNRGKAKNVILFLGDGMSAATLAATRRYLGKKYQRAGEELKMSFESFPFSGLVKTYCMNRIIADCACSATAYLSGVKANVGTVGLSAAVRRGDCKTQKTGLHFVSGLMDWAQKAKKGTGLVTTTRVTDATPAAAYAHSADVRWESDTDLPKTGIRCKDIATQLVEGKVGSNIDVVLGGGRKKFLPINEKDPEGYNGFRIDGVNLTKEWITVKKSLGAVPKYVYNKDGLMNLDINVYNSVLGLFSPDHMPYHLDAGNDDPTLSEMTKKAIQMLSKKNNGFFLFVEGGRIDTAQHDLRARKGLDETAEFAKAVKVAIKLVNFRDTLVVVTSDHSHMMTYKTYNRRAFDTIEPANMFNGSNNNGSRFGLNTHLKRRDIYQSSHLNGTRPFSAPRVLQPVHSGEDVVVYAKGPWAHLFSGNYEQNFLPHAIAYASCIGPRLKMCKS